MTFWKIWASPVAKLLGENSEIPPRRAADRAFIRNIAFTGSAAYQANADQPKLDVFTSVIQSFLRLAEHSGMDFFR